MHGILSVVRMQETVSREEQMNGIETIRELRSHTSPEINVQKVVEDVVRNTAKDGLKRKDPFIKDSDLLPIEDSTIEGNVLGCLIADTSTLGQHLAEISSDDFYNDTHKEIFSAVRKAYEEHHQIDLISLKPYISNEKTFQYALNLMTKAGAGVRWRTYVDQLHDVTTKREAQMASIKFISQLHNEDALNSITPFMAKIEDARSKSQSFRSFLCKEFYEESLPEAVPLLTCDGVPMIYRDDIMVIQGQAKSCKSTITTSLITSATTGDECLKFRSIKPLTIVIIDTEQSTENLHKQGKKTWGQGADKARVFAYGFRSVPRDKVMSYTLQAIYEHRPDIVIIDNVKDLVSDFNNLSESTDAVRRLLSVAEQNKCAIVGIIHENFGEGKARGHIGSMLYEKASTICKTERLQDSTPTFKVSFPMTRNKPISEFMFRLDDEGFPELTEDYTPLSPSEENSLVNCFISVFKGISDGLRHKALCEGVMAYTGKKISTAKTMIRQAQRSQIIYQSQQMYYLSSKFNHRSNEGQF